MFDGLMRFADNQEDEIRFSKFETAIRYNFLSFSYALIVV